MKGFNLNLISKYRAELMGLSILWIWFLHMSVKFPFPISTVQSLGATGVDIFFFVSAVGLYYSLSKNEDVFQFYKRRVLRIIPTYLMIAIPYRICEYFSTEQSFVLKNFLSVIAKKVLLVEFWIENSASLWYIPAILVFYLFYPLFYKAFKTEKSLLFRVVILVLFSVLAIGLNWALVHFECARPTDRWLLRIPIFLLGCFTAPYIKGETRIKTNNAVWIIWLLLVYAVFNFLNIKTGLLHYGNVMWSFILNSLIAIPIMVLVPLVFEKLKLYKLKKVFSEIGKYTLEIYILNEAALDFARNQTQSKILIDLISLAVTVLIMALIILCKKTGFLKRNKQKAYGNK